MQTFGFLFAASLISFWGRTFPRNLQRSPVRLLMFLRLWLVLCWTPTEQLLDISAQDKWQAIWANLMNDAKGVECSDLS